MNTKEYMLAKDFIRFSEKTVTEKDIIYLFGFTHEEASFLLDKFKKEKPKKDKNT